MKLDIDRLDVEKIKLLLESNKNLFGDTIRIWFAITTAFAIALIIYKDIEAFKQVC